MSLLGSASAELCLSGRHGCCLPDNRCGLREGDCLVDGDCIDGLVCGKGRNGCNRSIPQYHLPLGMRSGSFSSQDRCCTLDPTMMKFAKTLEELYSG